MGILSRHFSASLLILFSALVLHVEGAIQIQPTSLNPGDQYRLFFVTSIKETASHVGIDWYNTFVNNVANFVPELAALGTEWKVVGSTDQINARDNTGTDPTTDGVGVPIFLLNDTLLVGNYTDLWENRLERDPSITEMGEALSTKVWTGSHNDGTAAPTQYLGSGTLPELGYAAPLFGNSTPTISGTGENRNGWMFDWAPGPTMPNYSFYAMSSVLTVPDPTSVVPEATSLLTWSLGLLALTGVGTVTGRRR